MEEAERVESAAAERAEVARDAVPGDAQHSYKNILKAGFHELYLRENFAGDTSRSAERGER